MSKPRFERNFMLLAAGAFLVFSVGAILTTIVPPIVDKEMTEKIPSARDYTEQEKRGRDIYIREGCVYCHTQQIRKKVTKDPARYGWRLVDAPASRAEEYVYDRPHLIGTKRTGPDLARVGGKYSSEWHWAHFKDPRNMGEKWYDEKEGNTRQDSLMQSFKYLSDEEIKDLTAYLQQLGRNIDWRERDGKKLNDYEE